MSTAATSAPAESKLVKEETTPSSSVDVNEWVKQVRSDIKDAARKEKVKNIVLYAVQEALKQHEKVKVSAETFKKDDFRALVMQLIEGSFRFIGYTSTIVIFGNKFSYEAKSSKATMSLFTVG